MTMFGLPQPTEPDPSLDGQEVDVVRGSDGGLTLLARDSGQVLATVESVAIRDALFVESGDQLVTRGVVVSAPRTNPYQCTPDELVRLGFCGDMWLAIVTATRGGVHGFYLRTRGKRRLHPLAGSALVALSPHGAAACRLGLTFVASGRTAGAVTHKGFPRLHRWAGVQR